jgi:competence protein ComEA
VSVVYRAPVVEVQYMPVEILPDALPLDNPEPEPDEDPAPVFPLDLNLATREELMHVPGIGEVLSGRIVQYRDHIGGYTELSQLTNIYGISANTLERIGVYFVIG